MLFQSVIIYFEAINSNRYKYRGILLFAADYIYPEKKDNTKFNQLCDFYGRKSIKMTILFMCFIMLSTAQGMIGPILEYSKTGILITFLALKLPFIDEDSVWGFHLNVAIQTTITAFGTIGGLATEMASCIVNNTILLCSEIIVFNCDEFGKNLISRKTSNDFNMAHLRQIFIQIQDLDRYILQMSDVYYWRLFSAPVLIVYSVSISVFCQYVVSISI